MPQGPFLRKYGVSTTVPLTILKPDGSGLMPTATFDAGDVKVSKNEGADANITTLPGGQGNRYYLSLSAAEMTAARVEVCIKDQSTPQTYLDTTVTVETYGHASAQHVADLSVALAGAAELLVVHNNVVAIKSKTDPQPNRVTGIVGSTNLSATTFSSNLSGDNNSWIDCFVTFKTGALANQTKEVIGFTSINGVFTTETFTGAPSAGDEFLIVNI